MSGDCNYQCTSLHLPHKTWKFQSNMWSFLCALQKKVNLMLKKLLMKNFHQKMVNA